MKIFKFVWFVVSISMIGVSGYFLAIGNDPKSPVENKKAVKKVVSSTYTYATDDITLNSGATQADAALVMQDFENAFVNNSWWWMPKNEIKSLASLDNKYRLAIAANRIKIINNKNTGDEKYELGTFEDDSIMTKTSFKRAWEATVGLDVTLTDGNPCADLDYCNQDYEFDEKDDHYDILNTTDSKVYASIVKYENITKAGNLYTVALKALYISEVNGKYSLYSDPSKSNKLADITAQNTNNLPINTFLKENSTEAFAKANTYQYTFLREGSSFLFNSYNFIKGN